MPFFEYDRVVNEGERLVARKLRDKFEDPDADWFVLSNVSFPDGGDRWRECDAIALSTSGYGYLIEVKYWAGPIRGSDKKWLMPNQFGRGDWVQSAPVGVTESKGKKLDSWIRKNTDVKGFHIDYIVVVVDPSGDDATAPSFPPTTKSARSTVTARGLLERLEKDPRNPQAQTPPKDPNAARTIYEHLKDAVQEIETSAFGEFELEDLEEERSDGPEIWTATMQFFGNKKKYRLKRFPLDLLADDEEKRALLGRATRDASVVEALMTQNPHLVVSCTVHQEGSYVVVSAPYPEGTSFLGLLLGEAIWVDLVYEYARLVFKALGELHMMNFIHRNIRPASIWLNDEMIKFSDFDFARAPDMEHITKWMGPGDLDDAYAAPEVILDPFAATERSDVYSAAKVLRHLLDNAEDSATGGEKLAEVLDRCLADSPEERPSNAGEVHELLTETTGTPWPFEVGDTLNERWVISEVKEGGLSYVYKIWDTTTGLTHSAKCIKPEYEGQIKPADEFALMESLLHRNLVIPRWFQDMHLHKRKGQRGAPRKYNASFLTMDWVHGSDLGEFLGQRLPLARILEIGSEILDGLAYLHDQGIIHRDVKPGNILIEKDTGTVKIIDFNVSTNALDDTSVLGTPGYKAPEVSKMNPDPWTPASDVWSTGVCLVELLAHAPLAARNDHSKASSWLKDNSQRFSVSLTGLIEEMLDERPEGRPSAENAAARLKELLEETPAVPVSSPPPFESVSEGNRYVEHIMKFFSQGDDNAGTRWSDDPFAQWLYVDTDLDRILRPEIINGSFGLVIITGNAGDGKTAFVRNLETTLVEDHGAKRDGDRQRNGSTLTTTDWTYHTNWDGSQEVEGTQNEDVLSAFFEPFQNCGDSNPTPTETALIAINEGRLVDFLTEHSDIHPDLERHVDELLRGGKNGVPGWLTLINLNKRTLTGPGSSNLVEQLALRLADDRLWEDCTGCPAAERCPSRTNAETLRHPVLGQRVIERVRETLDVVRLRGRIHLTTRDLLSALSFLFTGNRTCRQLIDSFKQEDHRALLDGHLYNRLFAGVRGSDPVAREDRLMREIGLLDVAQKPQPEIDGRLWLQKVNGLHPAPDGAPTSDRALIEQLLAFETNGNEDTLRYVQASLRRKLFVETEDPNVLKMLPYEYLGAFLSLLEGEPDELEIANSEISEAISASEGLPGYTESVAVRLVSDLKARDRSFVTQPVEAFETTAFDEGSGSEFFEHGPRLLRFTSGENRTLELDITVDVYEVLMRMRAGYTPSREDLRGAWLSLESFKQRVAAMSSMELLLRSEEGHRYRIAVDDAGRVNVRSAS